MTVLQVVALVAVGAAGTATVLTRQPVRQAVVSGVFGLTLTVLFFVFAAPDVAMSQLVVATVAVPLMVLLALAKIHKEGGE